MDALQQYSGALSFLATLVLVAITAYYAYVTKGILEATANQARLAQSPVVGINLVAVHISEVFGQDRRNMSVSLDVANVGNAPAIELLVDAEIDLQHSDINGLKTIPARFTPEMIAYLRPGENSDKPSPNFGNTTIAHFFDDVRESNRLNLHRIKTDPTRDSYRASRLRVVVYYRNVLGQYFKSVLETDISLWEPGSDNEIPPDDQQCEVHFKVLGRERFHAGTASAEQVSQELELRSQNRFHSGW